MYTQNKSRNKFAVPSQVLKHCPPFSPFGPVIQSINIYSPILSSKRSSRYFCQKLQQQIFNFLKSRIKNHRPRPPVEHIGYMDMDWVLDILKSDWIYVRKWLCHSHKMEFFIIMSNFQWPTCQTLHFVLSGWYLELFLSYSNSKYMSYPVQDHTARQIFKFTKIDLVQHSFI